MAQSPFASFQWRCLRVQLHDEEEEEEEEFCTMHEQHEGGL